MWRNTKKSTLARGTSGDGASSLRFPVGTEQSKDSRPARGSSNAEKEPREGSLSGSPQNSETPETVGGPSKTALHAGDGKLRETSGTENEPNEASQADDAFASLALDESSEQTENGRGQGASRSSSFFIKNTFLPFPAFPTFPTFNAPAILSSTARLFSFSLPDLKSLGGGVSLQSFGSVVDSLGKKGQPPVLPSLAALVAVLVLTALLKSLGFSHTEAGVSGKGVTTRAAPDLSLVRERFCSSPTQKPPPLGRLPEESPPFEAEDFFARVQPPSGEEPQEQPEVFHEECVPCPIHAKCNGVQVVCLAGFSLDWGKGGFSGLGAQPSEKGRESVLAKARCVPDAKAQAKAEEAFQVFVEILKKRRGDVDCGKKTSRPTFSGLPSASFKNSFDRDAASPQITRWELIFLPEFEGVFNSDAEYFWFFEYFLSPQNAAEAFVRVSSRYEFVALPNPLKFEREHQIFQTEQRRSKALTFAYAYEGPFPRRSPLCEVRLFVEAHAAALISGFLLFLLIGVVALAVWRERYVRFAVRQEVLVALRELSQQRSSSEAAFQGVNSTDLFCKVLDQLAAKPLLQRVLLRGGLSERTVRSVCERLSEEPDSGVLKIEAVGGQETWRVEPPISSRVADSLSQRRSTLGSVVQTSLEPFVESLRPPSLQESVLQASGSRFGQTGPSVGLPLLSGVVASQPLAENSRVSSVLPLNPDRRHAAPFTDWGGALLPSSAFASVVPTPVWPSSPLSLWNAPAGMPGGIPGGMPYSALAFAAQQPLFQTQLAHPQQQHQFAAVSTGDLSQGTRWRRCSCGGSLRLTTDEQVQTAFSEATGTASADALDTQTQTATPPSQRDTKSRNPRKDTKQVRLQHDAHVEPLNNYFSLMKEIMHGQKGTEEGIHWSSTAAAGKSQDPADTGIRRKSF